MDKANINELKSKVRELEEQLYKSLEENCRLEKELKYWKRLDKEQSNHISDLVHEIDRINSREVKTYDLSGKID